MHHFWSLHNIEFSMQVEEQDFEHGEPLEVSLFIVLAIRPDIIRGGRDNENFHRDIFAYAAIKAM